MKKFMVVLIFVMTLSDFSGYPPNRKPDVGAFEFHYKTPIRDLKYRIANNWLTDNPNGDFNYDYVCNFKDFAIWAKWWAENY